MTLALSGWQRHTQLWTLGVARTKSSGDPQQQGRGHVIPDPGSPARQIQDFSFLSARTQFPLHPRLDVGQAPACHWGNPVEEAVDERE